LGVFLPVEFHVTSKKYKNENTQRRRTNERQHVKKGPKGSSRREREGQKQAKSHKLLTSRYPGKYSGRRKELKAWRQEVSVGGSEAKEKKACIQRGMQSKR